MADGRTELEPGHDRSHRGHPPGHQVRPPRPGAGVLGRGPRARDPSARALPAGLRRPGFDGGPGRPVAGAGCRTFSGLGARSGHPRTGIANPRRSASPAPGPDGDDLQRCAAWVSPADPSASATCISATRPSSSNWIRSDGSTLPSGCPLVAAPWARVRASSKRPPPGVAPPMSWRRSPRSCSSELPPPPGPGISTSGIVGPAGGAPGTAGGPGSTGGRDSQLTVVIMS